MTDFPIKPQIHQTARGTMIVLTSARTLEQDLDSVAAQGFWPIVGRARALAYRAVPVCCWPIAAVTTTLRAVVAAGEPGATAAALALTECVNAAETIERAELARLKAKYADEK